MIRSSVLAVLMTIGTSLAGAGLAGAGLAGAGFAGTALAMDVPPPVYAPETSIDGVGQGWYMRGDFGYTGWTGNQAPEYNVFSGGTVISTETFDEARFGKHVSYGAGVGYQLNDMLRTDATLDFFHADLDGASNIALPCSASQNAGTSCGINHKGDFRGISLLGNLYADLGTFAGITPYVGGGAGVTNISWNTLSGTPYCVAGSNACNGQHYATVNNEGVDSWRFTYALMAGFSYDVTSSMKLDFGYRFSKMNGGGMMEYSAAEKAGGARGYKGSDDGLSRHEIRAGLRINTW